MEAIGLIELSVCSAIIATAVYFFADARSKAKWIERLTAELKQQQRVLQDWQDKALVRHGSTPMHTPTSKAKKPQQQEITPKVVTRQQLEYRNEDTDAVSQPVTIHAHDVSYSRVARTVEKAAEIIAAHK